MLYLDYLFFQKQIIISFYFSFLLLIISPCRIDYSNVYVVHFILLICVLLISPPPPLFAFIVIFVFSSDNIVFFILNLNFTFG